MPLQNSDMIGQGLPVGCRNLKNYSRWYLIFNWWS